MKQRLINLLVVTVGLAIIGCATPPQRVTVVAPPPPPVEQPHPLSLPDIKALTKAGISEDVILSQIRNSHSGYQLSTADIIDLKEAGVSNKIIDFMINTPPSAPTAVTATNVPPATTNGCDRAGCGVSWIGLRVASWLLVMEWHWLGLDSWHLGITACAWCNLDWWLLAGWDLVWRILGRSWLGWSWLGTSRWERSSLVSITNEKQRAESQLSVNYSQWLFDDNILKTF